MNKNINFFYIPQCSSTQDLALELCIERKEDDFFVFTSRQLKGRGSQGRVWEQGDILSDEVKENKIEKLTDLKAFKDFMPMTWVIAQDKITIPKEWLPYKVGEALKKSIDSWVSFFGVTLKEDIILKWPNDIYSASHKKLAGILCESRKEHWIIGIGLNFQKAPESILHAISLVSLIEEKLKDDEYYVDKLFEYVYFYLRELIS
jgi:biotin-(acetyl-CoA carboxylase) ligase